MRYSRTGFPGAHQFNSPALVCLEISAFQNSCVLFTVFMAKSCEKKRFVYIIFTKNYNFVLIED